ncbi:MAG: hypothetical protein IT347_02125 [Candidatus Eisenbacteria bacterium]|nr:hypothetical protein [Candidatus Eisenbacteria bacterium]
MRRAIVVSLVLLAGVLFLVAGVLAQGRTATRVNAIGFIDYSSRPTFKVGDWVRYHVTGESELGMHDDYEMTLLIAGEELFWGDSCFWIETWMDPKGGAPTAIATLMSYSIFRDSLPVLRMQMYQRKQINEVDRDGHPLEVVMEPAPSLLRVRDLFKRPLMWDVDTLGVDSVATPAGEFRGLKISVRQGTATTRSFGDSSRYDEVRENRVTWMDPRVPITHTARESLENIVARRTWMIGRSSEGTPLLLRERGLGSARLVAMGHDGQPRILPPGRRMSGTVQAAAAPKRSPAPARPKR